MQKLTLVIELTYDDDLMHGSHQDSIEWFEEEILLNGAGGLSLFSGEIGDTIGEVTIKKIVGRPPV